MSVQEANCVRSGTLDTKLETAKDTELNGREGNTTLN